jgi:hypothetical protein
MVSRRGRLLGGSEAGLRARLLRARVVVVGRRGEGLVVFVTAGGGPGRSGREVVGRVGDVVFVRRAGDIDDGMCADGFGPRPMGQP